VLNPDFTELRYRRIDIEGDGVDEILVVGRETRGLARGPGFQVWDGSGNLILTRLALNGDFSNVRVFVVDQDGDGDGEIGIGGVETGGLVRGPAYQLWESDGNFILGKFVLNADF